MKKVKLFTAIVLFITFCVLGSYNTKTYAITKETQNPAYYSISSDYAFRIRYNSNTNKEVYPASGWTMDSNNHYRLNSSYWSKGNVWIKYTNVGIYNGRPIDIKIVYTDWNNPYRLCFESTGIGGGYAKWTGAFNGEWLDIRVEFYYHDTGEAAYIKGHEIVYDLDYFERWEPRYNITKIIKDSNQSYVDVDENTIGINVGGTGANDGGSFAFLYEGTSYTYRWRGCYYQIGLQPLFKIEVPNPTKSVSTTTARIGDTLTYNITELVPSESPEFYYSGWTVTDTIPSSLSWNTGDVWITNEYGSNVTGEFSVSKAGNTLSVRANNVGSSSFYAHQYTIHVNTVVTSANLANYTSGSGTYLGNTASITTNRGVNNSNSVSTEIKYNINTSIDHGTITATSNDNKGASTKTVQFTPQRGYYINRIVVDGVEQNINNFNMLGDSYTFSNITTDHSIQVYTLPMRVRIKIDKQDIETGKTIQGDAVFAGAEYTIYKDAGCTQYVEKLTLDSNGYATSSDLLLVDYVNGSYIYNETYYVKETKAPTGYNIDTNVYPVYQDTLTQNVKVAEQTVTSKELIIKNNIEIVKYIEKTDSTLKQKLSGVIFKATLNSDTSKVYYSTETDQTGYCVITDLPYGTYTVTEMKIPGVAFGGKFYVGASDIRQIIFEQFVQVDKTQREPYRYSDITNVAKKMQITIYKEDIETGTTTQGDAHLEGAEYTLYRDEACTDAIETVTIQKNADGTYSATSGWYLVGTYYVKETRAPEGYLIDNNKYTVSQDPTRQTGEFSSHTITSKDEVKRNDIDITKYLEETDSTEKQFLKGAEFTAQLVSKISPDSNKEYKATTDNNGHCVIEDLPYGTYKIWESKVPDTAYNGEFYINGATVRSTEFEQFIELDDTEREAYKYGDITDVAKKMRIIINKEDDETGIKTQGDAHLEGAQYTLYRDENCTDAVETITIQKNADGTYSATSGWYLVGKYWVKETKAPEGYLIDETIYPVEQVPKNQTDEFSTHHVLSKDKVMEGIVRVIKYNNNSTSTEKTPATGSKIRLTLDSNPQTYYEAIIDEYGYAEFVDVVDDNHYSSTEIHCNNTCYPYTIPYGVYTVSEVQASNSGENIYINKQKTEIRYQDHTQRYILDEEYIRMKLTIQVKDSETDKLVPGGATYKIWDVNNQRWYEEMIYPSGEYISEFTTDENGQLTINRHLEAGSYVIYEIKAPEGYYLNDELREGSKGYEFTVGVAQNGEVKVYHNDEEDTLTYTTIIYDNIPTKMYAYTAVTYNDSQKAVVDIEKLAEQFTKIEEKNTEYGNLNTPVFELKGLEGVSFRLVAQEDVVTPEGTIRYTKGQVVSSNVTSKDGVATTNQVYLGKYRLEEVSTPNGYINITEPIYIEIKYTNQFEKVQHIEESINNDRQKIELEFEKDFKELEVSRFKFEEQEAIFGIYTKNTLKNYNNQNVLGKDELVDIMIMDENNNLKNNVELPEGEYYVKELYVSSPYEKINEQYEFNVEYLNNTDEKINLTINNGAVINEASTKEFELIIYPDVIYDDLKIKDITDRETLEELAELYGVADKTYGVYLDKECAKPVMTIEDKEAKFVTDENGIINIPDMPTGTYYLKELVAPYGYELSEEIIKVEIGGNGELILIKAKEPLKKANLLQKKDTFTDDVIPGVKFEITDKEDTPVYSGVTNKDGMIEIPIIFFENGEKYYYKEVSNSEVYEIDEEKHEFTAKIDEEECKWILGIIPVGNDRKTIDEVIVRKTDRETGERLEGCVFTVVLLDENGEEYVNKNGEKIYLVKDAVTNEEGEYVIKDVPYGTYRFVEIKAPEGYEMDEDITGLEFTVDKNSPDTIIFEVTNTGDIAVVALVIVVVVCIAGILFVIIKKKKDKQ